MNHENKIPSHYQTLHLSDEQLISIDSKTHKQNLLLQKLLVFLMGNQIEITLKNGSSFEGILESVNLETGEYSFKYVRSVPRDNGRPLANWNVLAKDVACFSCLTFDLKAQAEVYSSTLQSTKSSGFQTDASISKASGPTKERKLEIWSDDVPEDSSLSLNYKPGEKWDQFAENEKRFGVKTDFHEELYTTVLDKSGADFKKKEEQAARLAKEIEKGSASNLHVAEERGQKVYDKDADEEEIYSSVAREKQADYNANLKLFDQITSKSKIRSSIPMNIASEIRKASIDQIAAAKSSKASTSSSKQTPVGLAITFDKASLTQSSEKFSAILAKQPIDDLKRKFKPFANDIKSHLTDRKQTILKEGRKVVIEDFKAFSTEFKIPGFNGSDKGSAKGSPKLTTDSIKTEPEPSTRNVSASATTSEVPVKSPSKKVKSPPEVTAAPISEAGSQETSTSTTKTFRLSATATEFTPSGYPSAVPNNQHYKKGGKKPYSKGNHVSGYYGNNTYYPPQDPAMYGQFYPQQQFIPPHMGPPQMYYPMYPPVAYAPNGAPIMNAPPYMGAWYPGMEPMINTDMNAIPSERNEGEEEDENMETEGS